MKSSIVKIIMIVSVVLSVGAIFAILYGQTPLGTPLEEAKAQGEIGPTGLGDGPPAGYEVYYQFSGVYNRVSDPEFATVVHCTNKEASDNVDVLVQFFDNNGGIPASAPATIDATHTQSFSTQPIVSFSDKLVSPNPDPNENIKHGFGWVLAPANSDIICTAQVLALDASDNPTFGTKLHLFDESGNCLGSQCGGGGVGPSGDIFLPIIFKNS